MEDKGFLKFLQVRYGIRATIENIVYILGTERFLEAIEEYTIQQLEKFEIMNSGDKTLNYSVSEFVEKEIGDN